MHLLIDADSLIYKAACPCETKEYIVSIDDREVMRFQYKKDMMEFVENMDASWGDFEWTHEVTHVEPAINAIHALKLKIDTILDETKPDSFSLYLTRGENFRHKLATSLPYKGNRAPKPVHHPSCFIYLVEQYGAHVVEGLEADDVVTMHQKTDGSTCIAHIDKDLDTVAGHHFNYDTFKFYEITEQEALCNFYRQMLVGDTSDNIEGVKGIGKVKAERMINPRMKEQEMINVVLDEMAKECSTPSDASEKWEKITERGRLLHMTRELDSDGYPVLWELPSPYATVPVFFLGDKQRTEFFGF